MKEKKRCDWCLKEKIYVDYHDNEWGVPVYDDKKLFEFLILEGAQAGLSWLTILRRRDNYKKAFADFDVKKVAKFDEKKILSLMQDEGIIRNQLKIRAAVSNAKLFIEIQKEFDSFSNYMWGFLPNKKPIVNKIKTLKDIQPRSEISDKISKDMKKRGFKFFGTTICYAHMQATGMVNDHIESCWKYKKVKC
ncbi:MAG TPA: DNA-3-methyladenine glycosylase I [Bacteroidia bacterium]|nr:DNA-3-methyladenine glycosylase I [Bacteroidia bacterium]